MEVRDYISAMQLILQDAIYWYGRLEALGNQTKDNGEMRKLIEEHNHRVSRLYGAALLLNWPKEAANVHEEVLDAFKQRRLWLNTASSYLDNGVALNGIASGQDLTLAQGRLAGLAATFDIEYPVPVPLQRAYVSQRHRVNLGYPGDWILADTDFQVVLMAPRSLQEPGLEALGPTAQKYGSAFKVWALKNPTEWDLAQADREAQGFLIPFGRVISEERTVVDQLPAIRRILTNEASAWETLFVVAVKGSNTYLVEGGCPRKLFESCRATFQDILGQLRLTG